MYCQHRFYSALGRLKTAGLKCLMSAVEEEAQQSFNGGKGVFLTALMLLSKEKKKEKSSRVRSRLHDWVPLEHQRGYCSPA